MLFTQFFQVLKERANLYCEGWKKRIKTCLKRTVHSKDAPLTFYVRGSSSRGVQRYLYEPSGSPGQS